jgi:hypothetical protein
MGGIFSYDSKFTLALHKFADLIIVKDCFVHHMPTGSSYDFATSEKFIHDYSDEQYGFLLFHDPEIMKGPSVVK